MALLNELFIIMFYEGDNICERVSECMCMHAWVYASSDDSFISFTSMLPHKEDNIIFQADIALPASGSEVGLEND